MKIELANNFGLCEELPLKSKRYVISMYMPYLKLYIGSENINNIIINGKEFEYEVIDKHIVIPCLFNIDNVCTIEINYDNQYLRYMFKYDKSVKIDNKLIELLGDFHRRTVDYLGIGKIELDRIVKGIEEGEINLLHFLDPMTGIEEGNFMDEIEKVIPFALNICSMPRKHLKVENEILDIERVKKITPNSLMHLSSHSEHWKAKTITGLVPSRILAEVYEDDIDIYENIFFKMVIDKILSYVVEKQLEVNHAISQKNRLIDWQQYGNVFSDYKRGEMIKKLIPEYDIEKEDNTRERFVGVMDELSFLENGLSSIVTSQFYQSINKYKRLTLPIQPTNIIKMDNRYNELFNLWNKFLNLELLQSTQVAITGAAIDNINYYYLLYVQISLVYGLSIFGLQKSEDASIEICEDGLSKIDITFYNEDFEIRCLTNSNEQFNRIDITITEKPKVKVKYPLFCNSEKNLKSLLEEVKDICEIDPDDDSYILFKRKPSADEEREISNIFRKTNMKQKGKFDKEWRQFIANTMINFTMARKYEIQIYTMLYSLGEKEINLKTNTETILNSGNVYHNENENLTTIFALPIDLYNFMQYDNKVIVNRMLNYGESYEEVDAIKWGDYKIGILPIFQTEVNSTQRLIKLISMHLIKLGIEWNLADKKCPVCNSHDIIMVDSDTYKCRNTQCNVLWGTTSCSSGCKESFSWIRPDVNISKFDVKETHPLELKLKKETIFDRLIITDFDFIEENNSIKYVPKCPKCGKSSATK